MLTEVVAVVVGNIVVPTTSCPVPATASSITHEAAHDQHTDLCRDTGHDHRSDSTR